MTELTKKTTGFLAEFRQFIARGNVLDMAVGVIIGGAFGKISTSLVNDILMPLLSLLTGGADFSQWQWVLREAVYDAGGAKCAPLLPSITALFSPLFWTSSSSPLRSSASSKLSTASTERRRPLLLPRPSPRRRKCCWRRSETC